MGRCPAGLTDELQVRQFLDQRSRKISPLLGQYHHIGIFQTIRNFIEIRFRISVDLDVMGAELWKALQGLKSTLIIVNDGNLHSTFALVKSVSVVAMILNSFAILLLFTRLMSISSAFEHLGSSSYYTLPTLTARSGYRRKGVIVRVFASWVASRVVCKLKGPLTPVLIEVVEHRKNNSLQALSMSHHTHRSSSSSHFTKSSFD